ncbi:hypothetical protein CK215_15760 [Mesorhizobium sp. WSM3864]|uniref:TIR domain-containing protein n=1 Tax=Mesorhizobium sp. WSM3864 TaxID=2029404 RepID=UPI000BAEFDD2|nr:TIR domain-containing protein [Mesorhizobium sp. WSM3864]PBB91715.1 hypothetical protein CK215_15760 [Mesorhizobium sp. WSM3864]
MKIFLGYPSEHEKTAWEVYTFLKSSGDEVWFDKLSLVAGADWDREREKGQREAELIVHLCSNAILKRAGVVNREIRQTLRLVEDQPFGGSLYVIPIRLEPMKMPLELTRFQYFDFVSGWQNRLGEGVEKRRAQLSGDVPSPSQAQITDEKRLPGLQKVEFEGVTEVYECRGEYLRYEEESLYWTFVNAMLAAESLKGFYDARSSFLSMGDQEEDKPSWEGMKHEWSINAEEVYRNSTQLSLRFYTYIGFVGAAHPNHYITTLNFLGEEMGSVTIEQLFGHSAESALKVLTYCEKVIIAEFEGEIDQDTFFEGYKETEEQVWKLLSQFNFDRQGMTFNFSPYDVLPYVFGSHEVHVPWRFIESLLADDYKGIIDKLTG